MCGVCACYYSITTVVPLYNTNNLCRIWHSPYFQDWLEKTGKEQDALEKNKNPVLKVEEMKTKRTALERDLYYLVRKPIPQWYKDKLNKMMEAMKNSTKTAEEAKKEGKGEEKTGEGKEEEKAGEKKEEGKSEEKPVETPKEGSTEDKPKEEATEDKSKEETSEKPADEKPKEDAKKEPAKEESDKEEPVKTEKKDDGKEEL